MNSYCKLASPTDFKDQDQVKNEKLIEVNVLDLRKWSSDKHKTTDDNIFGGGPGMLMKIQPIYNALKELGVYPKDKKDLKTKVILTSAKGTRWNQSEAKKYVSNLDRIVIICGHYEGVDHRVSEYLIDEEVSIGDYVLSGGELASMILLDSVSRLIPGVLGNEDSLIEESHSNELNYEYPQYTRPARFDTDEGLLLNVPDILLSGDHMKIKKWKENRSIT